MSNNFESTEHAEQELRNAYLYGCRLLQWMAERLPVDRKSCMMRGMKQADWYSACSLLVGAGIIDSRLAISVDMTEALGVLRQYFDTQLAVIRSHNGNGGGSHQDLNATDSFGASAGLDLPPMFCRVRS